MSFIKRSSNNNDLLIIKNGQEKKVASLEILNEYKADGIIRIHQKDYQNFPEPIGLFTHFNLEHSGHCPDKIYILPRIIKPGFFVDQNNEQLPLLDFKNCYITKCLRVAEGVAYEDLDDNIWQYSFLHIRDVDSLQQEILWRYKKSLPKLTAEELIVKGVSITYLKIVGES